MNRTSVFAWYTGGTAARTDPTGSKYPGELSWRDASGNGRTGVVNGSTATVLIDEQGLPYVQGTAADFAWLSWLPDVFTLCSVTRSPGGGRVLALDSSPAAWFHGHSATQDGVAAYGGAAKTSAALPASAQGNWVWMCTTNAAGSCAAVVNGVADCAAGGAGGAAGGALSINPGNLGNAGLPTAGQSAGWAVYEVIVFSGGLNASAMAAVSGYFQRKYALASFVPPPPLAAPTPLNNVAFSSMMDRASGYYWRDLRTPAETPHKCHAPAGRGGQSTPGLLSPLVGPPHYLRSLTFDTGKVVLLDSNVIVGYLCAPARLLPPSYARAVKNTLSAAGARRFAVARADFRLSTSLPQTRRAL